MTMRAGIERLGEQAVGRLLNRVEAVAADELPLDVRLERDGDRVVLVGRRVRLRALTDGRIASLVRRAVAR